MSKSLPLTALHTFVEVGRCGSMKRAAEANCVSPGAVSQQIKNLEDRLMIRLFTRTSREVELTAAGQALFDQLLPRFEEIEAIWSNGSAAIRRLSRLTISTTASFAGAWLIPRLGHFNAMHPNIEVSIESSPRPLDLRREYVDIAIRHGLGTYPGHSAFKIWTPELLPVCSARLLRPDRPIASPKDCLDYPLLQDADRADWTLWLRAHGIDDTRALRGTSFNDDSLLVKAAVSGQGIALVRDVYAKDEIASGRLIQALDLPWPTQFAYYVVCSDQRADEGKITAFRTWIQEQIARETAIRHPYEVRPAVSSSAGQPDH
ncbi:LysR substrate-binding domain-containing protein [Burkholderia ubonensis]|nr:LysR substrate-binding domain-containing protein [Burkholderia ubonensis]KWD77013.1 transcriptional regulator [Burkholderia ubonensis]KWD91493.1 transcriptional regulator [Burkholderia ubonensis]KWD93729.1 transcriptional regulator [Burkholderia ubonensis]